MPKKGKKKKSEGDVFKVGKILGDKQFKTPKCVFSFPKLFQPESFKGSKPKYKVSLVFDNDEVDLSLMKKVGKETVIAKYGSKKPKRFRNPFRDGEEREESAGYEGNKTFVNVSSEYQPLVVDKNGDPIVDQSEIYAGCIGRAIVSPFVYESPEKGLSFALLGVQKLADGEQLGGGISKDAFGDDDTSQFGDDDDFDDDDDDDDDDLYDF